MTFAVNKKRAAAYNQVLNDLAMRVFGREPDDAINEGTCLGCNAVVDVDTLPIFRQERYLVCGMCSTCQANWLPEDVADYPKRTNQEKYWEARKNILRVMSPMGEPYTKEKIIDKTNLEPSTVTRHINDLLEDKCIYKVTSKKHYNKSVKLKTLEFARKKSIRAAMPPL